MSITLVIRNYGLKQEDFEEVIAATNDGKSVEKCEHHHGVGGYDAREIVRLRKVGGAVYALLSDYRQHHLNSQTNSLEVLKFNGHEFVSIDFLNCSNFYKYRSRDQYLDSVIERCSQHADPSQTA